MMRLMFEIFKHLSAHVSDISMIINHAHNVDEVLHEQTDTHSLREHIMYLLVNFFFSFIIYKHKLFDLSVAVTTCH